MNLVEDDLDAFGMEVLKHFGIKLKSREYYQIETIEEFADLVLEYLNRPNGSIPVDSSSGKRPLIPPILTVGLGRLFAWSASWVVGLDMLFVLIKYTDWPFVLIITPVVLWISVTSWLILHPRS